MKHRLSKALMALAALASLGLGAGAIANATTGHTKAAAKHAAVKKHTTKQVTAHTSQATTTDPSGANDPADGPNDPADSANDPADSANEPAGTETPDANEPAGSEQPGNDGPGGHADEPGNPNANHEATGAE